MTPHPLRPIIFGLLLAIVSLVVVQNVRTNARLLASLQSDNDEVTARAFRELLARPDHLNLVQTLSIPQRQKIASRLARWDAPEAVRLAGELLQDPEPEVRESLTECLIVLARKFPSAYAEQLSATKPEVIAGLIDAAERSGKDSLVIAEKALRLPNSRENAVRLFLRLGEGGKETLARLLQSSDSEISLLSAEVLSRIPSARPEPSLSKALLVLYQKHREPEIRERLLVSLSAYPSLEAKSIFERVLGDVGASLPLRSACASALIRLGAEESLWRVITAPNAEVLLQSPIFLREVGKAFAKDERKGVQRVIQSPLLPRSKVALLAWNNSPEAEIALLSLARQGVNEALIALSGRNPLQQSTYMFLRTVVLDKKEAPGRRWLSARCLASTPEGRKRLQEIPTEEEGFWIAKVALDEVTSPIPPDTQNNFSLKV